MSDAPALKLDQFAKISARIRAGTKRSRALDEANIDKATWLSAQVYWLSLMAKQVASGDNELHSQYLSLTEELMRGGMDRLEPIAVEAPEPRLAPLRPPVPLEPAPPPASSAPAAMPSAPAAAPSSPAMASVPSAPPPEVPPPAPAQPPRMGTSVTPGSWSGQPASPEALPFRERSAAPAAEAVKQAQAEAQRPSLPFGKSVPPAAPEPSPAETADDANPGDDRYVLPFVGGSSQPPAPSTTPEDPSASAAAGSTVCFPAMPDMRATPFEDEAGDEDDDHTTEIAPEVRELGATMGLDNLSPLMGLELPFQRASKTANLEDESAPVQLTVEQYASLCASCEAYPNGVDAICKQYGLSSANQRATLDRVWREKMKLDAGLSAQFQQKVEEFKAWLLSQRT